MGYGYYVLPDGREAGYGVEAECDHPDCATQIDRGLGYLCGVSPDGHRDCDEPGCGNYYCGHHEGNHDCPNPKCGAYSTDGDYCGLAAIHDEAHYDEHTRVHFTVTEEDEE